MASQITLDANTKLPKVPQNKKFGVTFYDPKNTGKVQVRQVQDHSYAWQAGIRPQDEIITYGDHQPATLLGIFCLTLQQVQVGSRRVSLSLFL